jgi:hypothetical protein
VTAARIAAKCKTTARLKNHRSLAEGAFVAAVVFVTAVIAVVAVAFVPVIAVVARVIAIVAGTVTVITVVAIVAGTVTMIPVIAIVTGPVTMIAIVTTVPVVASPAMPPMSTPAPAGAPMATAMATAAVGCETGGNDDQHHGAETCGKSKKSPTIHDWILWKKERLVSVNAPTDEGNATRGARYSGATALSQIEIDSRCPIWWAVGGAYDVPDQTQRGRSSKAHSLRKRNRMCRGSGWGHAPGVSQASETWTRTAERRSGFEKTSRGGRWRTAASTEESPVPCCTIRAAAVHREVEPPGKRQVPS